MDNDDRNKGNDSISDEDSIPIVISGRQYERRTIENIFHERVGFFDYLLNLLERHTYNKSDFFTDKCIQDIDRRIVLSEYFKPEIRYYVKLKRLWFFISSHHEERSPEFLGFSDDKYLY